MEIVVPIRSEFAAARDRLFARLRSDIEAGLASGDVEVSGDTLRYKAGFLRVRSSLNTSKFYGLEKALVEVAPVPEGIRIRYALDYGNYSWVTYAVAIAISAGMAAFTHQAILLLFPFLVGVADLVERQRARNVMSGMPEYFKKTISVPGQPTGEKE